MNIQSTPTGRFDPDVNHAEDFYAEAYIRDILRNSKVIAMVGASTNWNRPSYFAMKYLQQKGFRVIPVNPRAAGETLLGETVRANLGEVSEDVDIVDIFRNSEAASAIVDEALATHPECIRRRRRRRKRRANRSS